MRTAGGGGQYILLIAHSCILDLKGKLKNVMQGKLIAVAYTLRTY